MGFVYVGHAIHNLVYICIQIIPPNEQQKQNIQEKEQNKIQRIKQIIDDNLRRVKQSKQSPKSFFKSVYEKFDPRQTEVSCRHCYLNNKQVEYSFFQQ